MKAPRARTRKAARAGSRAVRRKAAPAPDRFELVMRAINEGVYDYEIEADRIYYSPRIYEVLDISRRRLRTSVDWRNLIHPDDRPGYFAAFVAHVKGKAPRFEVDHRYRARDGSWRWARQHGIALRNAKGRAVRMVGSIGDITDLKRAEEALKASEDRYALATRAATEGIYEWNLGTDSLYLSDRAKAFFSVTGDALTPEAWNARVHEEDFQGYRDALVAYFKGRAPHFEREYRIRNATGGHSWVIDRGVAVRDKAGRVIRMVGALSDVTQRRLGEIELSRARDEATEALAHQTATADVLKVISRSSFDLQVVLDTVVESATRQCGADHAWLFQREGEFFRWVASFGHGTEVHERIRAYFEDRQVPVDRGSITGRAALEARVVQVPDVLADREYTWSGAQEIGGYRSALGVPLLREGKVVGVIFLAKTVPQPFTAKQIEVATTFADQAVIAIENARLFNETKEALERQTATAEILKVIASSPTDIQPVCDRIAEQAMKLCGALFGFVARFDGELVHLVSIHGGSRETTHGIRAVFPLKPGRETVTARAIQDRAPVQIPDVLADSEFALKKAARAAGYRSLLSVPQMREGQVIGAIAVGRAQPGVFPVKQIALLEIFADQAVIAIENVRLFRELRATNASLVEALEQQTATSELLKVIGRSNFDLQPVFESLVENAVRLCGAERGVMFRVDGPLLRFTVGHNVSSELREFLERNPITPGRNTTAGRAAIERRTVHNHDVLSDPEYSYGGVRVDPYRTMLAVPILRADELLGVVAFHRYEVRPFTDSQVALLETFADQAAIAIENARLFNETKEALEQQRASAEILSAISSSIADTKPVFDRIALNCEHLFGGVEVIINLIGADGLLYIAGHQGAHREHLERNFKGAPVSRESGAGRCILEKRSMQYPDIEGGEDVPPVLRANCAVTSVKACMYAPLVWEDQGIGAIFVGRRYKGPFSEKEMALLKTFADQAVIAIQNARLFNETKEALERQTATSEILRVISGSPTDTRPVFDVIAKSGLRLFGGLNVAILLRREKEFVLAGYSGPGMEDLPEQIRTAPLDPEKNFPSRAILEGKVLSITDWEGGDVPEHERVVAKSFGIKSGLMVPLLRQGEGIGAIAVVRATEGPFTDKDIALLQSFADQAVIAIENVRLFNETKEALEHQKASTGILRVVSSSIADAAPVFEAIAESCAQIFRSEQIGINLLGEDGAIHLGAYRGRNRDEYMDWMRTGPTRQGGKVLSLRRGVAHFPDVENGADVPDAIRQGCRITGSRSIVFAPMISGGRGIGAVFVGRDRVGPFSEKEIALLTTFCEQAVIAIQNARLFRELQERTEALTKSVDQLTALGEVGQAISSTLDLETVLKTIVSRAVQLAGLDGGTIYEFDDRGREFHLRAAENMPDELAEVYRRMPIRLGEGIVGGAAAKREPVQVPDIQDPSYQTRYRELLLRQGYRAILAVPLLREDQIIGALTVSRNEPGAFAPEVIDLLKTFASQSALAIQNARLFREIAEKSRELELASRHKSQFLASMSHELRTPLNALLGFNEMILGDVYGEVPGDMKPPLAQMQASGKHLLRLINNVLDLAKIEAGRMELALSDYSVHDTVESVRSALRPLAADKGLELLAAVPADIPLAHGDPGRITQCLMNLAGNSLKFTKAGKVEISVVLDDGRLRYSVADTGIGIPADKIESLFTEFKQTDAAIASEYGGTGLGLSITKKFVEMHGGRIWVESEPGHGSTFSFEIPLRAQEAKPA